MILFVILFRNISSTINNAISAISNAISNTTSSNTTTVVALSEIRLCRNVLVGRKFGGTEATCNVQSDSYP